MDSPAGALNAQAELRTALPTRWAGDSRTTVNRGEEAARIASGAIDPGFDDNEATPLLRDRAQQVPEPRDDNNDDDTEGLYWPGQKDLDGLPWWKKPSIYWLLPFFLLFALSFGGMFVPRFNLVTDIICRDYYTEQVPMALVNNNRTSSALANKDDPCGSAEVSSRVTLFMLGINLVDGLLGMLTSAKWGSLSDRYGRKPVMAAICFGGMINTGFYLYAAMNSDNFNPYLLYIGSVFDGIVGSFISAMALCNAYAADCTHPNQRNVAFGYFHVCLFGGIALGPIMAGLIIKKTGSTVLVFWIAFASVAFFLFALVTFLPESLPKHRQIAAREKLARHAARNGAQQASWFSKSTVFGLFEPLQILWPTGPGTSPALRRNLALLAAIDATMFGVATGLVSVILAYLRTRYGWETFEQSIFTSTVNSTRTFWLFVFLPVMTRIVRGPRSVRERAATKGCDALDLRLIRSAVVLDCIGYLGYALAPTGPLFVLAGCVASFGGIGSPTLQSSLTKHVPQDRIGQLLGAIGLLHAMARVVGPLIFNAIFVNTVKIYSPTVFLCLSSAFVLATIMSWFLKTGVYWKENAVASDSASSNPEQEDAQPPS